MGHASSSKVDLGGFELCDGFSIGDIAKNMEKEVRVADHGGEG